MNQKKTLLVLGLTLAIVAVLAVTPIVNELAYAHSNGGRGGNGATGSSSVHGEKGGAGDTITKQKNLQK